MTSVMEVKGKWLLSVSDEMQVLAECVASARRGLAADLRVILTLNWTPSINQSFLANTDPSSNFMQAPNDEYIHQICQPSLIALYYVCRSDAYVHRVTINNDEDMQLGSRGVFRGLYHSTCKALEFRLPTVGCWIIEEFVSYKLMFAHFSSQQTDLFSHQVNLSRNSKLVIDNRHDSRKSSVLFCNIKCPC